MPLYTTTFPTLKSTGSLTVTGDTALTGNLTVAGRALRAPQVADHGLKAWSFDPRLCSSSAVATAGTVFLSGLFITESFTATSIYWGVSAVATTPTAGQNFVGLYDSAGTRQASVGVDSATESTGLKTSTISAALTAGQYWVAFVFNASTPPQLPRSGGAGASTSFMNAGLSAASYLSATNGTLQTSLPASITPSSNAVGTAYWAAVS